MHPPGTPKSQDAALEQLWLQVCAWRGTPAPDPAQRAQFLQGLAPEARRTLESVLSLAARGRERPGDLSVISWAASCTRPALLAQLAAHGLAFIGANLFACGLTLKEQGWDMQPRLAQLASHPEDVAALRAWLPAAEPEEPQAQALAAPERLEEDALGEAFYPWPEDDRDDGPRDGHAPGWEGEAMDSVPAASASTPLAALPALPTRHERQRLEPFSNSSVEASARRAPGEGRLRLRLFGKAAAHTLEVTPHRRGGDFLGVQVVSIDSAHALGTGGGYAWERKLVIQLTPEEMPAVIATLMGITPSVRFGHHGAGRDKFVEVRRQEGGLVIVTGEKALSYSVPVPTASIYYVLDLFCRAMAMAAPGRSVAEVLLLVKSMHGV
jgi:hypothetical protein